MRKFVEANHESAVEGRMSLTGAIVLIGCAGAMFATMSYIVFVMGQRIWPVWMFWAGSLLLLAVAVAVRDVMVTRVVVTETDLALKRAWTARSVPLSELRAIRVVKAEYVVETADRRIMWIPMFISNRHAVVDKLQRAVAANVVDTVEALTPLQRELVRLSLTGEPRTKS